MADGVKVTCRVEGLAELDAALVVLAEDLGPAKARTPLRQALTDVAKPMRDAARSRVRVYAGPGESARAKFYRSLGGKKKRVIKPGELRASIRVGSTLNRSQRGRTAKESGVEVYMGPSGLVQGITEEFGTYRQAPHPFMRPAWEAGKAEALASFKEKLTLYLVKAVARATKGKATLK